MKKRITMKTFTLTLALLALSASPALAGDGAMTLLLQNFLTGQPATNWNAQGPIANGPFPAQGADGKPLVTATNIANSTPINLTNAGNTIGGGGFASFATNRNVMAATGWTNTNSINMQVLQMTGTGITYTNGVSKTSASLGTITVGQNLVLKPKCGVYGSTMAATLQEGQ
jgi:hypothetical protein